VASRVISSDVSDYRNPIIAEAMKVLGYVNCYNRGINMVQDELEANGNAKAEFSFRLITAGYAAVLHICRLRPDSRVLCYSCPVRDYVASARAALAIAGESVE
jgi:hypothetical protein